MLDGVETKLEGGRDDDRTVGDLEHGPGVMHAWARVGVSVSRFARERVRVQVCAAVP